MQAPKESSDAEDVEAGSSGSGTQHVQPGTSTDRTPINSRSVKGNTASFYSAVRAVIKEQKSVQKQTARPGGKFEGRTFFERVRAIGEGSRTEITDGHGSLDWAAQSWLKSKRTINRAEDVPQEPVHEKISEKTISQAVVVRHSSDSLSYPTNSSESKGYVQSLSQISTSAADNLPSYLSTDEEISQEELVSQGQENFTNRNIPQATKTNTLDDKLGKIKHTAKLEDVGVEYQCDHVQSLGLGIREDQSESFDRLDIDGVKYDEIFRLASSPVNTFSEVFGTDEWDDPFAELNIEQTRLTPSDGLERRRTSSAEHLWPEEEEPKENLNRSSLNDGVSNGEENSPNSSSLEAQSRPDSDHTDRSINYISGSFHEPESLGGSQEFLPAQTSLSDTRQGASRSPDRAARHALDQSWSPVPGLARTGSSVDPRPHNTRTDSVQEHFEDDESNELLVVEDEYPDAIVEDSPGGSASNHQSPSSASLDGDGALSESSDQGTQGTFPDQQSLSQLATSAVTAVSTILAAAPSLDSHLVPRPGGVSDTVNGPLYYGPTLAGVASSILSQIVQAQTNNSQFSEFQQQQQQQSVSATLSTNRRRRLRISPAIPPPSARQQVVQPIPQPLVVGPQALAHRVVHRQQEPQRFGFNFPVFETRPNPPPISYFPRLGPVPAPLLVQVRTAGQQLQQQHNQPQQQQHQQQDQDHHQQQQQHPQQNQNQENPRLQQEQQDQQQEEEEEAEEDQRHDNQQTQTFSQEQPQRPAQPLRQPEARQQRQLLDADIQPFPPPAPPPLPLHLIPNRNNLRPPQINEVGAEQRLVLRHHQPPSAAQGSSRRNPSLVRRQPSSQR
ncbi:hypothetical protein RRG08_015673 [Elysia crispata]|uniref:Uncharacterized protein n=1 Tax=Elysia crispata TaxID=231223 RepID=A0AAE0Y2L3_9GAST|nr:hypothetical protein RRG08_015673 [Elysia crispata]